jgi:predicted nuclease with TOPRIM domain
MQVARQSMFKITPPIKKEIEKIVEARIKEAHVTKEDFSALKNIVKDLGAAQKRTELKVEELAEAQKRTELKVEELAVSQKELAEAQKRSELRIEALAEAQKRTELVVAKLVETVDMLIGKVRELDERMDETNRKLGGLDRSLGYAFENEAYRHLPEMLKRKYGIEAKEKIIRADVGGKEINVFCRANRDGREVLVVGEAKTKLDERKEQPEVFEELEDKVKAVLTEYPQAEIVRVLVAHFALKSFLDKANARGIIVVQSFEW